MLNIQSSILFLALFALAITGCTIPSDASLPAPALVSPRDAMSAAEVVQSSTLDLTLGADKEQYVIGEPVYITARLTNIGGEVQQVFSELRPSDGATHILVTTPDGRQGTFSPLVRADYDSTVLMELNQGETIGAVFPVFFGAEGWTFTEPGKYLITAIYETPFAKGQVAQVKSEPISILVEHTSEGSGEFLIEDGEASFEAGKFLTWQAGDHLMSGQERLEALLERWPDSLLANYANFAFGKSLSEPFADYRVNAIRPADCERAMSLLAVVDENLVSRHILLLTNIAQARCELNSENWDAAREHLARSKELAGDLPEYEAILGRVNEYGAYLQQAAK